MKYFIILTISISYGLCLDNKNDEYNEIVGADLKETINKQLPKESKFFDELDCEFYILLLF